MDPQSLAEAQTQFRRYDPERWRATLFAPADLRFRLVALYAFNIEIARVRETVSEAILGQIRLQWWREALGEIAAGGRHRQHPIVACVAAAKLDLDCLNRAIDARERDLDDSLFADIGALEVYASESAGAIFEAAFLAANADPGPAKQLGTGYALVGLLRAVPFFARQRRILLPADLLAKAGLAAETIHEGKAGAAIAACIEPIARRARNLLETNVPRSALVPALPAALAKISLKRLAAVGFDPFAPALQNPHPGDIWRLLWTRLSGRL
jgi:NADH dehydrogenase [ubiquinone] 1 alpha subcomplex assembly factor 6